MFMCFTSVRRCALRPDPPFRCDVQGHVTVEQPVARALRAPSHRHRHSWLQQLSDDVRLMRLVERGLAQPVAERLDVEVETMQMHWVLLRAQVDDAPADAFAETIGQVLGRRPRQAVDQRHELQLQREEHRTGIVCVQQLP
jgi:hypothetical protein